MEKLGQFAAVREDVLVELRKNATIRLVISANCLSQLPRALLRQLERQRRDETTMDQLGAAIIGDHLDDLKRFSAPVILLTDTTYSEVDGAGKVLSRHDLLHGVALPRSETEWDWDVAPPGEARRKTGFQHHVIAACLGQWPPH
jgi:hypothetical protein